MTSLSRKNLTRLALEFEKQNNFAVKSLFTQKLEFLKSLTLLAADHCGLPFSASCLLNICDMCPILREMSMTFKFVKPSTYKVGDRCMASWQGSCNKYPGVITAIGGEDGPFDILFDDGDSTQVGVDGLEADTTGDDVAAIFQEFLNRTAIIGLETLNIRSLALELGNLVFSTPSSLKSIHLRNDYKSPDFTGYVIPPDCPLNENIRKLGLCTLPKMQESNFKQFPNLRELSLRCPLSWISDHPSLVYLEYPSVIMYLSPETFRNFVAVDLTTHKLKQPEFQILLQNSPCLEALAIHCIYPDWAREFLDPKTVVKHVTGKSRGLIALQLGDQTPILQSTYHFIIQTQPLLSSLTLTGTVDDEIVLSLRKLPNLVFIEMAGVFSWQAIKFSTWERLAELPSLQYVHYSTPLPYAIRAVAPKPMAAWVDNGLKVPLMAHYNGFLLWLFRNEGDFSHWGRGIEIPLMLIVKALNRLHRKSFEKCAQASWAVIWRKAACQFRY